MSFDHAIFLKLRYPQANSEVLATIAHWIGIEAAGLLESLASDQGRAAVADGVRPQHIAQDPTLNGRAGRERNTRSASSRCANHV